MAWLDTLLGTELSTGVRLAILLVVLVLALSLLLWVFRKVFGKGEIRQSRKRQPRLSVSDAAVVDDKRRLVLVRRDNVEHLIMIGGPTDIVIEQNIGRQTAQKAQSEPHSEIHAEPQASFHEQPVQMPKSAVVEPKMPEPAPARPVRSISEPSQSRANAAMTGAAIATAGTAAAMADTISATAAGTGQAANEAVAAARDGGVSLAEAARERMAGIAAGQRPAPEASMAPDPVALNPVEPDPGIPEPEVQPEPHDMASLAEDLGEALGLGDASSDQSGADAGIPEPVSHSPLDDSRTDDEMQRLLDELARETKS